MKAEMLEKYGIGKRQGNARGASIDNKVRFAADLGIDPTGLNYRRSDSASIQPEAEGKGTPVKNKNSNPMKASLPVRKTGDPLLLSKGLGSADNRNSVKNPLLVKRPIATSKLDGQKNPWDEDTETRPTTEFLNQHRPIVEEDNLDRKPRNLKPLRRKSKSGEEARAKTGKPFKNVAEEFLKHREKEKAEAHLENVREMQKLNEDMDEYLAYAKPGTSVIDEMNNAFEGGPENYELVEERKTKTSNGEEPEFHYRLKKVGFKPKVKETVQEVMKKPLDPIKEEYNDMQIVPVSYDAQKKHRNELLKQKAKMMSNPTNQANGAKILFDADMHQPKEKTFVTGGGVPGRAKKAEDSDDDDLFLNEEDELLDIVDKQERDMKDMLKYLNEVEEMMGGNDLA